MNVHSGLKGVFPLTDNDKRLLILKAGLDLFNEFGFHATSVPLIAKQAGIAVGTIYHHFKSKEAIVNELYRQLKGDLSRTMLKDFPFDAPMRVQFTEYWRRMTQYMLEKPEAFLFMEAHHHAPYLDDESRQIHTPMMDAFRQVCENAKLQGAIKPLPFEVITALTIGTLTSVLKASTEGRLNLTNEILDHLGACLWDAISITSEARK